MAPGIVSVLCAAFLTGSCVFMYCVPGTGRRQGKRGRHLAGGICGTLPRQQETVTTAVCFEKLKVEGMQGDWEKAESKDDGSLD